MILSLPVNLYVATAKTICEVIAEHPEQRISIITIFAHIKEERR